MVSLFQNIAEGDPDWVISALIVAVCFFGSIIFRRMCLSDDEKNYDWERMWQDFYDRLDREEANIKEESHLD